MKIKVVEDMAKRIDEGLPAGQPIQVSVIISQEKDSYYKQNQSDHSIATWWHCWNTMPWTSNALSDLDDHAR